MHSAMLTKTGELWCWGMGLYGALGQGSRHDAWVPPLSPHPSPRTPKPASPHFSLTTTHPYT